MLMHCQGSISKTMAAWCVMKLVEDGKVALDEPAENYIKWRLPNSQYNASEVTVRFSAALWMAPLGECSCGSYAR